MHISYYSFPTRVKPPLNVFFQWIQYGEDCARKSTYPWILTERNRINYVFVKSKILIVSSLVRVEGNSSNITYILIILVPSAFWLLAGGALAPRKRLWRHDLIGYIFTDSTLFSFQKVSTGISLTNCCSSTYRPWKPDITFNTRVVFICYIM